MQFKKYFFEFALSIVIAIAILAFAPFTLTLFSYEYMSQYLYVLGWPLDNLLASKDTQGELSQFIFGGMTPNFAPIQLILYFVFWPSVIFVFIRLYKCIRTVLKG